MSEIILECSNLTKKFGNKTALDNVSLQLRKGKIIGLLGPNGSGKTTFIKIANGLLTPNFGTIKINGMEPGVKTKEIVSYLPDINHLSEWMTVSSLIKMFDEFYEDFIAENAYEMIKNLNISPDDKYKSLSKGNKEKISLILVKLYLLDEPIGGVDPATREYILNSIIKNYSADATILISTHLISDVEPILDEVVFVKEGGIVLNDTVDNLRETYGQSVDSVFREVFKC